jgi:hypothetical protein
MNILLYIGIELFGFILRILTLVIYIISFFFRDRIVTFNNKRFQDTPDRVFKMKEGYKEWKLYFHPYFWLFWFTCNGLNKTFSGPEPFMREQKKKWFPVSYALNTLDWDHRNKFSLRYFWICYRWNAIRNPHWAFNEWFFGEGKWKEGSEKVKYCYPMEGSIYKYWDITPQLKWDEGNDMGKVLKFQTPETPVGEIWWCTHIGKKALTFTTHKGNKRFMYCFCKIVPFFKKQLLIEHHFGWNWWNGIPILHFKHILR